MRDSQIVGEQLARVLPQYNKPWFKVPHLLQLNLILLVPLLSSAVSGYDGSLINGIQATPSFKTFFNNPTGSSLGFITAAQSMGSVAVLPVVGWMNDRIGRKWTLIAGILGVIISSIIQTVAPSYAVLIVSRVLVGISGMLATQPAAILITELAYPTHRGKFTSLFWTCYYLGAILAAWATFGTQKNLSTSNWSWRLPSILQALYPCIQGAFVFWLPESPRWLISKGRSTEARRILAKFHTGGDDQHELIELEMKEITNTLRMEMEAKQTKWSALYSTAGNRRRLLIVCLIGGFAQWCGVAVVSYFLTLVLDTVGVTDPDTQTLINGLLQLFNFGMAVSAAFLVDRLGRRTLLLWSGFGMLASFIILTACAGVFDTTGNKGAGIVVIICIFTFFGAYDIGYTPLLFGYTTELLPFSIRAKGLTAEMITIYGSLIVLAFVNPIALENIGWKYYLVFVVILVVICITTWLLFPETRGYSLEEIADIFDGPRDHHIELSESEDKAAETHQGSNKTGVEFYEHNTKA